MRCRSSALQALSSFYSGKYFNLYETRHPDHPIPIPQQLTRHLPLSPLKSSMLTLFQSTILLSDNPTVRSANAMLPLLLQRLMERKPENLDYLDVSYGLTSISSVFRLSQFSMSRFRKRAIPLHIRHPTSELTGEYTCVILLWLNSATDGELDWMAEFAER